MITVGNNIKERYRKGCEIATAIAKSDDPHKTNDGEIMSGLSARGRATDEAAFSSRVVHTACTRGNHLVRVKKLCLSARALRH